LELSEQMKRTRRKGFHTNSILLTGHLLGGIPSVWGDYNGIIQGKLNNFVQYSKIYPECQLVFIGDNGQGDYLVGKEMLKSCNQVLDVFIHQVLPKESTFGYNQVEDSKLNIHFFKTYVGAAIVGYQLGYFNANSLLRIIEQTKLEFIQFEISFLEESLLKENKFAEDNCCFS